MWWLVFGAVVLLVVAVGARTAQALRDLHATTASTRTTSTPDARNGSLGSNRTTDRRHPAGHTNAARPSKLATLAERLDARIDRPRSVSVAAVDVTSGRHFRYGASRGMVDASVSKLDILEALLLNHQDEHTSLAGEDDLLATAMIEHSDNSAGQTLWNELGYAPSITAANTRLGLRHTVPDPAGYYGLTTSCAVDQVALLENLLSRHGPLTRQSRKYALTLLGNVESDQRWGVGVVADPGTTFANKNGWLSVDNSNGEGESDDDLWLVDSVGIVTVHGQQVLLSVFTQHGDSYEAGVRLVESLVKTITPAVVAH